MHHEFILQKFFMVEQYFITEYSRNIFQNSLKGRIEFLGKIMNVFSFSGNRNSFALVAVCKLMWPYVLAKYAVRIAFFGYAMGVVISCGCIAISAVRIEIAKYCDEPRTAICDAKSVDRHLFRVE